MHGIDYGSIGQTNRNTQTGIRYGVINQNEVLEFWAEASEADYGEPTCPECGEPVTESTDERDWSCKVCNQNYWSDQVYGDEAQTFTLSDDEYEAEQSGSDCDIFVTRSPYFTYCNLCSPCAPGAGYLLDAVSADPDNRAYCFGHDCFDSGKAPYPVYSVETGEKV